jgi:hypothetical protein
MGALRENILGALCRDVETDLRLHIHSSQIDKMDKVNPVKTVGGGGCA